jgi:hypothetical protein
MKAMSNELKAMSVFSLYSLLTSHCLLLIAYSSLLIALLLLEYS